MKIGIIGGSGLYGLEGWEQQQEVDLSTPFGTPSCPLQIGTLSGIETVFLPRHGPRHHLLPAEIPYLANIWALKKLGVTHVLSVSAVGSLQAHINPGELVFPDQFINRTWQRRSTFFGNGIVAHVQFGYPVCPHLLTALEKSARQLNITAHRGGSYVCIEGPTFSSRAESMLYQSWGGSVIGMTNLPEAILAREAEMCFATIALATDYDSWHEPEEEVSVPAILEVMKNNIVKSRALLVDVIKRITNPCTCGTPQALQYAIITPPESIPAKIRRDLEPLIGHLTKPD